MATKDLTGMRLTTPKGIPYKLLNGYPKFGGELDTLTGEEEVIVAAAELEDFLLECIPRDNHLTSPTFSSITLPKKMPGAAALSCVKFEVSAVDETRPIDPFNADPATVPGLSPDTYGEAIKVHLWYATIARSFVRDITVGIGAEYLHIPPNKLFVSQIPESTAAGRIAIDPFTGVLTIAPIQPDVFDAIKNQDALIGTYKLIPTAEWNYKLQPIGFPTAMWSNLYANLGKLNNRSSPNLCENAPVDTVLFAGITGQRVYSNYLYNAASSWLFEFKFSQRIISDQDFVYTWNHAYSPSQGKWTKPVRAMQDPQTGKTVVSNPKKYLFDSTDLALLFDTVIVNNP